VVPPHRTPSPLRVYVVLSLLLMAAIGAVLGHVLEKRIHERARGSAERSATMLVRTMLDPVLRPVDLAPGRAIETRRKLDALATRLRLGELGVERIKVFDARGTVVWSDLPGGLGRHARTPGVRRALRGEVVSTVVRGVHHDDRGFEVVEILAPLRLGRARPVGLTEIYLDHRVAAAEARRDARRLYGVLAGCLLLLWLVLLRIVAGASRALRRQVERSAHLVLHDPLTGLPNRRALEQRLAAVDAKALLILFDLDDFKAVNTLRGIAHGDALLQEVAARLCHACRDDGFCARLGGDEFAVLLEGSLPRGERVAERIAGVLSRPTATAGTIRLSAGHASAPRDAALAVGLIPLAGAALAAAKRKGGGVVQGFRPDHAHEAASLGEQRLQVERLLTDPSGVEMVTQPIVDLASGSPVGFEALARFPGRSGGPDRWFAQAQRVGLGAELEIKALRCALALEGRPPGAYVAVNLSPSAVCSSAVVAELPGDLSDLVVEITEHERASDADGLRRAIAALRERGARIAVDDAGAGHANLLQTISLGADLIKLDRALIAGLDEDAAKRALVQAFATFARDTGARLCAEGVETLDELRALVRLGVTTAQGYGIARPGAPWPGVDPAAVAACAAETDRTRERQLRGAATAFRDASALLRLRSALGQAHTLRAIGELAGEAAYTVGADALCVSVVAPELGVVVDVNEPGVPYAIADYAATADALATGRAVEVRSDDPVADRAEVALLEADGFGSVLLVPIFDGTRPIALLEAYACDVRSWSDTDADRARLLALLLAPALTAALARHPAAERAHAEREAA